MNVSANITPQKRKRPLQLSAFEQQPRRSKLTVVVEVVLVGLPGVESAGWTDPQGRKRLGSAFTFARAGTAFGRFVPDGFFGPLVSTRWFLFTCKFNIYRRFLRNGLAFIYELPKNSNQ